jgi:tetratricopeptide (TPR) repeat protein
MKIHNCVKPLLLVSLIACSNMDLLHQAEDLTQKQQYDEAIATYRLHISERLQDPSRLNWENPYFYLLRVGDIYLSQDKPQEALSAYIRAENEGVETTLISDRLRSLARWYEQHKQLDKAFTILAEHRSRDPLLFDSMLDRISRALTKKENASLPGT